MAWPRRSASPEVMAKVCKLGVSHPAALLRPLVSCRIIVRDRLKALTRALAPLVIRNRAVIIDSVKMGQLL